MSNSLPTATLLALAEPTRLRVVELLSEKPRPAGELAQAAAVKPAAMSKHLRLLKRAGLIHELRQDERDARLRIYSLRPERFVELDAWLQQRLLVWSEQAESFKEYVERTVAGDQ